MYACVCVCVCVYKLIHLVIYSYIEIHLWCAMHVIYF